MVAILRCLRKIVGKEVELMIFEIEGQLGTRKKRVRRDARKRVSAMRFLDGR